MRGDLIKEILFLEKLKKFKHVVRAFGYEIKETEDESKVYILMEKGDKDLLALLKRHKAEGSLSPARLAHYWEQMLAALQEVHAAGIVHADIKPANFLLVAGELKLIDFGMACEVASGQEHVVRHVITGTQDYMGPEQYAGMVRPLNAPVDTQTSIRISTKTDVWALGIILHQTIYGGLLPFEDVPGGQLGRIQAYSSLARPVALPEVPGLDPALRDTMRRCLEKDPGRRADVAELLRHPFLQPRHGQAEPPPACTVCRLNK
jgi:serine/threonine-protein kinase TTK/MPS1